MNTDLRKKVAGTLRVPECPHTECVDCDRKNRRGWTLIEMLAVIALMAVMLSASTMLLTAVMRSQGMLWADIQEQSARSRLAVQLRADAHGATAAESESPQVCDFLLESGAAVHYEIKGNSLRRELRQKDAVSQRETFPLKGLAAAFSVDDSQQRPLVLLSLDAVPERAKYARIARPSVLEAAVGTRSPLPAGRSEP